VYLYNGFLDEDAGMMELCGLGGTKVRFEAVTQGYQFIVFIEDAALFNK